MARPFFPRAAALSPTGQTEALSARFDEVRQRWIRALEDGQQGGDATFGYDIEWREIQPPTAWGAPMSLPAGIFVASETRCVPAHPAPKRPGQALRRAASAYCTAFPDPPVARAVSPLALDHVDDWARILAALAWFRDHPSSGLYLRQVDIPRGRHEVYREPAGSAHRAAGHRLAIPIRAGRRQPRSHLRSALRPTQQTRDSPFPAA